MKKLITLIYPSADKTADKSLWKVLRALVNVVWEFQLLYKITQTHPPSFLYPSVNLVFIPLSVSLKCTCSYQVQLQGSSGSESWWWMTGVHECVCMRVLKRILHALYWVAHPPAVRKHGMMMDTAKRLTACTLPDKHKHMKLLYNPSMPQ